MCFKYVRKMCDDFLLNTTKLWKIISNGPTQKYLLKLQIDLPYANASLNLNENMQKFCNTN